MWCYRKVLTRIFCCGILCLLISTRPSAFNVLSEDFMFGSNSDRAMGTRSYSKTYRGFLIQQNEQGRWIVPMLPTWSNGPVSQGPFSTYGIAEHVIDRVLDKK